MAMKRIFTALGLVIMAGYLTWNGWWLAHGQLAPSMLRWFTGIPCPTTGGTRSVLALARGDWRGSLRWNAMAIPLILLFTVTIAQLLTAALRRSRLVLPPRYLHLWLGVLGVAWVLKLVQ